MQTVSRRLQSQPFVQSDSVNRELSDAQQLLKIPLWPKSATYSSSGGDVRLFDPPATSCGSLASVFVALHKDSFHLLLR